MRKEGEDLSPRTGRRTQVRTPRRRRAGSPSLLIWAAGVMSCSPVIAGDVDRELSTKAMDDATPAGRAYVFPPLPCGQDSCGVLVTDAASGQEPGREARSAGTGSLRAGALCFVTPIGCLSKGWPKLQDWSSGTWADRSETQQLSVPCPNPAAFLLTGNLPPAG